MEKKKVVLLGDSIRLWGYGAFVPDLLGDGFEVWQPDDNCRFAHYTLRMLFDFKAQIEDADVIHWNDGAWDLCRILPDGETFTPIEVYKDELRRIAKILLAITDKVIFATTTPILEGNPYNRNEDVRAFNDAAREVLEPMGVKFNDLYSAVADDIPAYIDANDFIHLTPPAAKLCAEKVAESIKDLF